MSDKAFYNRKNEMFSLEPFTIEEISEYLGKIGAREKLLATLCVGGVPEYLHRIRSSSSILLGLAEQSFSKNGFFVEEYARIFVSSLSNNKYYKHIIKELAAKHFMTREELCSAVVGNINPGGSFTDILKDLESCGFIQKYSSIHLDSSDTKMVRYCIKDQYLNFFHRFIEPIKDKIDEGKYNESPLSGINRASFASAMGLVFEVWCRNHAHFFAKKLGFDKIDYDSGAFFNRRISEEKPGFQIDLIFIRKDSKIIIAEAKYYDDTVPKHIHSKVEEKKRLFLEHNPKYKNYTFETLLITTEGLAQKKEAQELFDHVITLQDIF